MKYLWLAVTPDEYELPLFVATTSIELAKKYGINENTVIASVRKNLSGKQAKRKFVRVPIEEE